MRSLLSSLLVLSLLPAALAAQDIDPNGNEVDWFSEGTVRVGSDGYLSGCPFGDANAQQEGSNGNAVYEVKHLEALARTRGPGWEARLRAAMDQFKNSRSTTESAGGSFSGPGATEANPNTPGTALCATVLALVS